MLVAAAFSVAALAFGFSFTLQQESSDPAPEKFHDNVSFLQSVTPSGDRAIASDFSWINSKGKQIALKDLKGKVVFINFWGTWCRPCRTELPDIVQLNRQYEGDVVFIGVAQERLARSFVGARAGDADAGGYPYLTLIDHSDGLGDAATNSFGHDDGGRLACSR